LHSRCRHRLRSRVCVCRGLRSSGHPRSSAKSPSRKCAPRQVPTRASKRPRRRAKRRRPSPKHRERKARVRAGRNRRQTGVAPSAADATASSSHRTRASRRPFVLAAITHERRFAAQPILRTSARCVFLGTKLDSYSTEEKEILPSGRAESMDRSGGHMLRKQAHHSSGRKFSAGSPQR